MNILKKLLKKNDHGQKYWEILRFILGGIFFWSFLDKTFGLGYATEPAQSWLNGVSPTYGFLQFGTEGSYFAHIFQAMAGSIIIDWLFMLGVLGIGVSLLLGIGTRVAGYSGALMMFLIYLASLPLEHHPIFDHHIVYIVILLAFTHLKVGMWYGLRKQWKKTDIVKKYPWME